MAEEQTVTTPDEVDVEITPEATEEVETTEEAKAEPDTESEAVDQETPAEKPKADRKSAKLSYELREMKRQNAKLSNMLEMQLETASKALPQAKAPKIEDFESMDEYLDARDTYRDAQREAPKKAEKASTDRQSDMAANVEELTLNGAEKYDDFEEVVFSQNVKISPAMADAIFDIDDPDVQVDIAYTLSGNHKEALRISKLSERRQIMEIGKLEAKLLSKPAPVAKASKAPEPIKPVGGAKTTNNEIKPEMTFEAFKKIRDKQLGR